MEAIAAALVFMTFFVSTAAVFIFRPLTRHLGDYLKAVERERRGGRAETQELERVQVLLERLNARLELHEDRLDFTERLLAASRRTEALTIGGETAVDRRSG